MPEIQPSSGGKAPVMEDDVYVVTCIKTELHDVEEDQFGNLHKVDLFLQVDGMFDEDEEPIVLKPRINQAWSEKATLFKYAQAFGLDPDPTRAFNTDRMHGCKALASIKTEREGEWPRVKNLMAVPKARPQTPPSRVQGPGWIDNTGEVDWNAYYKAAAIRGATKESVITKAGGVDALAEMSVTALADLLEAMN